MKQRRTTAAVGLALAGTLALASCGSTGDVDDEPQAGGDLVIAVPSPPTLNPMTTTNQYTQTASMLMMQGLTYLDPDFSPQPRLAESWEVSEDGTEYTYYLREGVTWHDGEPFDADDVVWTLTEGIGAMANANNALGNAIVTAEDDYTVHIQLPEPHSAMEIVMSEAVVRILPQHVYAGTEVATNDANTAPVGTGPFQFVEWVPEERIVVERYDDYWGEPAIVDTVTVAIIDDETTALNAVRSGEVDYAFPFSAGTLETAVSSGLQVQPAFGPFPIQAFIAFNTQDGPTSDPVVRHAIAMAVDAEQMLNLVWDGYGEVARGPVQNQFNMPFGEELTYDYHYPLDVDAANELLDAAGYERGANGIRFDITHVTYEGEAPRAMAELLASQLAEIGIDVSISIPDSGAHPTLVFEEFQFDTYHTIYNDATPEFLLSRQYGCASIGLQYGNVAQYCNDIVEESREKVFTSADEETYLEGLEEAFAQILIDLPYYVPVNTSVMSAARSELQGLDEMAAISINYPDWSQVWLD